MVKGVKCRVLPIQKEIPITKREKWRMFLLTFFSQTRNAYVNVAPITSRYKRQRWKIKRFADTDLEEYGQADNVEASQQTLADNENCHPLTSLTYLVQRYLRF